jgi:beta-lactamase class D
LRLVTCLLVLLLATLPATAQPNTLCTLVADAGTGTILIEEGDCTTPVTPASTFKVPLAVMGFDAGLLADAHAPVMQFRAGDPDWGANWKNDTDPAAWMRYSVLWYSQRIAHGLGAERLARYAESFGYGNADFSGDAGQNNGLDRAWISSSLQISPRGQAAFFRGLINDALPVSQEAMIKTRAIIESWPAGQWRLHGKTGSAYPRRADRSFDYARGWGWFAGWAEAGDRRLVMVRLIQTRERVRGSTGVLARDALIADWPGMVATLR